MSGGPCGACKFLKRKCVKGCTFAPYFDSQQGTVNFAAVHRVFGASKASKLLLRVPAHRRLDAVVTLCYEALARVRDPVYGCVAHIFSLQQQFIAGTCGEKMPEKGKNGVEDGGDHKVEGNESGGMRTAETLLRLLPVGLCVAALVVMLKNSQTNDFGSLSYSDLGAFK